MKSLDTVPVELLILVFRKMNPRSLCRLRQSCKRMDATAEQYRFKIESRSDTRPLVLCISLDNAETPNLQFNAYYGNTDYNTPSDKCMRSICRNLRPYISEMVMIGEILHDPVSQISGIRFDFVMMYCHGYLYYQQSSRERNKISPRQEKVWREKLFPFLANLKISSEWLYCWNVGFIAELTPIVKFQRFTSKRLLLPFSEYMNSAIWHCDEIDIEDLQGTPESLSPLVKTMKTVRLYYRHGHFTDASAWVLHNFLEKVVKDRQIRGTLECLSFHDFRCGDRMLANIDVAELCRMSSENGPWRNRHNDTVFETFAIDGGTAVVFRVCNDYVINFLNDVMTSRETLLLFYLPYMFPYMPYDASALFDTFTSAPSDRKAFSSLNPHNFYKLYYDDYFKALHARRVAGEPVDY